MGDKVWVVRVARVSTEQARGVAEHAKGAARHKYRRATHGDLSARARRSARPHCAAHTLEHTCLFPS
eukprot:scaffold5824_cov73-Phaeocystis_antarctica.AAC.3